MKEVTPETIAEFRKDLATALENKALDDKLEGVLTNGGVKVEHAVQASDILDYLTAAIS